MAKQIIEKGKALIQSKTFWFNLLFIAVFVANLFGFKDFEPSQKVNELLAIVAGVVNVYLRLKTKEPITRLN